MLSLTLVLKCVGASEDTFRRPTTSSIMRQWVLPFVVACLTLGTPAQTTGCSDTDDSQCAEGYYCVLDTKQCQECLRCEDLNRQPPDTPIKCIRSVIQCGPCLKGLVEDTGCTEPESGATSLPAYVIVIIIFCLVLFLLVVGALVYMLRHKDTFKILASTRTSVQAPVPSLTAPSAPAPPPPPPPPPPYHEAAHCDPERPSSPLHAHPHLHTHYQEEGHDQSVPLVKRAPRGDGDVTGSSRGAREAAGSQAARVYNAPAWVRNANPPPSYESAFTNKPESEEEPFVPLDEETMESVWTPGAYETHHDDGNAAAASVSETASGGNSGLSLALRRPSRSEVISPPPKIIRLSEQDSNNNRNSGESSAPPTVAPLSPSSSPPSAAAPAPAPSVVINVLNVNSLRQLNDVTL